MSIITDGKGKGTKAGVSKNGYLETHAVSESLFAKVSSDTAQAFELHPPRMKVNAAANNPIVYFKNTSATKQFHIERIRVWWNGGDTNRNRCCITRFNVGADAPTAGYETVLGLYGAGDIPHNMNLGSTLEPEIEFKFWDRVPSGSPETTGMTMSNVGEQLWCTLAAQGYSPVEFGGALIVPPGESFSLTCQPEEEGDVVHVISGYFREVE